MPTYEYQCDACEHNFDELQSFSDKPLKKCPKCGKPRLRRVIGTGAGIIFKGAGFYQTDYRSDSYKTAEKADQDSAKPSSGDKTSADGAAGKTAEAKPAKGAGKPDSTKAAGKSSKSTT